MTRHVTRMMIDDAEYYSPAQHAAIVASYPEQAARIADAPIPDMSIVSSIGGPFLKLVPISQAGRQQEVCTR
jgi:hypothetical protein